MEEERKESIMVVEEKEVEEVKMFSDNIKEPRIDLDKCSLNLTIYSKVLLIILLLIFIKPVLDPI
jgi:hypothetical protein